jgi:hypothetical protein
MEGQSSHDVVPEALAPAPVAGDVQAPGLVSALGNQVVARLEAGPRRDRPQVTPPSAGDIALGHALADSLKQRGPVSAARQPNFTTTPAQDFGPAGVGPVATPQPTPRSGASGMEGIGEAVKGALAHMLEERVSLEAEVAELEQGAQVISSQLVPGLSAGLTSALAHADTSVLSENLRPLARPLKAAKVGPDDESTKGGVLQQLHVAIDTLESMDEPVQNTVNDVKFTAKAAGEAIDAAIAAARETGAPAGGGDAKPRAGETQIASLQAAKVQLGNLDSLTATLDPASVASLASFTNATVSALRGLSASAHASVKPLVERAAVAAQSCAVQLEAMGRDKEGNYQAVARALGSAVGLAMLVESSAFIHLGKQKKVLAQMPAPEPPPAP